MKRLITVFFGLALIVGGCDITNLNENKKEPVDVSGSPIFSAAVVNMGNYLSNGVEQAYSEPNIMPQYWTTTSYPTIPNYNISSYSLSNIGWSILYSDVLKNLDKAKDKVKKNDELSSANKKNKLACIQVMDVLAYSSLINIFGDVPYKEALDPENTQPAFDDAEGIYMDLLSRLNTAIGNFDSSAEGFGSADVIYNGDIGKWEKFANSLKMRLAITIVDVNEPEARKAIKQASPKAFNSNDDNANIKFQSTPPNTNPIWEALVQSGRHDNVPSDPLVSRMNATNDPRRAIFFTKYKGNYAGGIYGKPNDYGNYSHFSSLIKKKDRATSILNFDEVEFIRAEAAARPGNFGISGSADDHYKQGIRADMEFWGVPDSQITSYLSRSDVKYGSASGDFRKKIGTQKWYSLFMQGLQAWTEVRRLDAPELTPSDDAQIDEFIKRYTYPADAQNLNEQNYNEASQAIGGDKLTTKLFWDVN